MMTWISEGLMNTTFSPADALKQTDKVQVRANEIPFLLDHYAGQIEILSLDCFDTLLWRKSAQPKDVFKVMQQRPLMKEFGITAHQRINAAQRAYRESYIKHGHHQITLEQIYSKFNSLTDQQRKLAAREELETEMAMCYPFYPVVELIRKAKALNIKVIIVSDIYLKEAELRELLAATLPTDTYKSIDMVFSSTDYQTAKSQNLFSYVVNKTGVTPNKILHLGDHQRADFEVPRANGIRAVHFLQFDAETNDFLHLQHNAAAVAQLMDPTDTQAAQPRYSIFRGVFSSSEYNPLLPEVKIGYMSFGPMLYSLAKFICDDIKSLQSSGKKVKVFFLLRDAYLLAKACEEYAGSEVGKLVRIRKFVTVASSFRTVADVDHYLSSVLPQYFNYWVICEQLLLPKEMIQVIMQHVHAAPNQELAFYQILHQPQILNVIFANSAAYRHRLKQYIQKEMQLESGDTVMLVDTGYIGVTQENLTRAFAEELGVEFIGRYFISSHEPDRPICDALLTSTWCEHGLFEQSCTYKEGAVVDYDTDGNPIFDNIKLSDEQYRRVGVLQQEALKFIRDAKRYFSNHAQYFSLEEYRATTTSILMRHIFFPTTDEIEYFNVFQHDKDMGNDLRKTMYHLDGAVNAMKKSVSMPKLHPYESRALGYHFVLSGLMQKGFDLEMQNDLNSLRAEYIDAVIQKAGMSRQIPIRATYTHDGSYVMSLTHITDETIGIVFGQKYQLIQIEELRIEGDIGQANVSAGAQLMLDKMNDKGYQIYECISDQAMLILLPLANLNPGQQYSIHITFKPLLKRSNATNTVA